MWAQCALHACKRRGLPLPCRLPLYCLHYRFRGSLWAGGTLCLCRQGGLLRPSWLCCNMRVLHERCWLWVWWTQTEAHDVKRAVLSLACTLPLGRD